MRMQISLTTFIPTAIAWKGKSKDKKHCRSKKKTEQKSKMIENDHEAAPQDAIDHVQIGSLFVWKEAQLHQGAPRQKKKKITS